MRFTFLLAACLLPTVALAQGPAFRRSQLSGGQCTFWNTRSLTFFVDAAGNPETTGNTEFTAITDALAAWGTAVSGCSDAAFNFGGTVTNPRVEYVPGGPNRNVVIFRQTACSSVVPTNDPCRLDDTCGNTYGCWNYASSALAVPTITTNSRTGEILDVDIELNVPSFIFTTVDAPVCVAPNFSQACVASDVQNTITPLLGRAIGLDFINTPGSTMFASAPPGEISKRVIDPDTVAGFCAIYPRALPATSCDGGVALVDAGVLDAGPGTGGGGGGSSGGGGGGGATGGGTGGGSGGGSGAPPPCSAVTCAGCCTFDGRCELGTSDVACGIGGLVCASCNGSDACQAGQCKPQPRGCGCGALDVLASVLALGLLTRRRRDARG